MVKLNKPLKPQHQKSKVKPLPHAHQLAVFIFGEGETKQQYYSERVTRFESSLNQCTGDGTIKADIFTAKGEIFTRKGVKVGDASNGNLAQLVKASGFVASCCLYPAISEFHPYDDSMEEFLSFLMNSSNQE